MTYRIEPAPFKAHAFNVTPWKVGTCGCGRPGWLRYSVNDRAFLCRFCHHDRLVDDWGRVEWLFDEVEGGRL